MSCISFIEDLRIEIETLKRINEVSTSLTLQKEIELKESTLIICMNNLEKLKNKDIECRLYLKIMNGKSATTAVREIADENYINGVKPNTESGIWKNYYKNLKEIIKV